MPQTYFAEASIVIDASPTKIWEVLTTPPIIKKWLFGTDVHIDWQEGGEITYTGVWEGKSYEDKGKIIKIEPEKYLLTTYLSAFSGLEDVPENYQNVAYVLEPQSDGKVKLTITQDNIKTEEAQGHSTKNWQMVLESLKKEAEGK